MRLIALVAFACGLVIAYVHAELPHLIVWWRAAMAREIIEYDLIDMERM